MLTEEMIFWSEEEGCNGSNYCENLIDNILEYMLDHYSFELDMDSLYHKSLEKVEMSEEISFSNIYYNLEYEYTR